MTVPLGCDGLSCPRFPCLTLRGRSHGGAEQATGCSADAVDPVLSPEGFVDRLVVCCVEVYVSCVIVGSSGAAYSSCCGCSPWGCAAFMIDPAASSDNSSSRRE